MLHFKIAPERYCQNGDDWAARAVREADANGGGALGVSSVELAPSGDIEAKELPAMRIVKV